MPLFMQDKLTYFCCNVLTINPNFYKHAFSCVPISVYLLLPTLHGSGDSWRCPNWTCCRLFGNNWTSLDWISSGSHHPTSDTLTILLKTQKCLFLAYLPTYLPINLSIFRADHFFVVVITATTLTHHRNTQ